MGGAAVSSADTGAFGAVIELNAIQRSNPEMQKRAANAIRGLVESENNPIVSIHDHGAGGHLNCLSELVEDTGGHINLDALPVGDPTLSAKEIIGNESQERMGLVIAEKDLNLLKDIAERERAPIFNVGEVSADKRFSFVSKTTGERPHGHGFRRHVWQCAKNPDGRQNHFEKIRLTPIRIRKISRLSRPCFTT